MTSRPPSSASDKVLGLLGEPLLSVREVAAFLGIDRATVYRLAGRPDGIPCVRVGGSLRFRPADVRAYVEKSTVRLTPACTGDAMLAAMVAETPTPPTRARPTLHEEE